MSDKKIWTLYAKPKYFKNNKRSFEINNYKSIKKIKIKLDKLTILVGENASGKSNVLEYLNNYSTNFFELEDLLEKMADILYNQAGGAADGYRSNNDEIVIKPLGVNNLKLSFTVEDEKEIFRYKTPNINTKNLPIDKTLNIGKYLDEGESAYTNTKDYILTNLMNSFKSSKNNLLVKGIPYFTTYLDMSNMNKKYVEEEISKKLMNIVDIGFNVQKEQNDIYDILSFLPAINTRVNEVLYHDIQLKKRDKSNNVDKQISVYLSLNTEMTEKGNIKVKGFSTLVRDEAENKVFPPHMKSSGVNNIISIIIATEFLKYLIEHHSNRNYSKLNYLFAIDEPELYLHPKIQKNLVNYIYNMSKEIKEVNYILATHSPYIVHPNTIESTYLLEYEVHEGTVAKKLVDVVENNQDRYNVLGPIEDSLGLSFNEFLHPIIFVEGGEEFEIFKRITKIYNYTNSIHSLKGKNKFAPIAILLNKFKNKNENFFVFLDADFDFTNDFKYVDNGEALLESLSNNIFFIGKKIYDYEEYKLLENKNECLEDFIIYNIFDDEEYRLLANYAKEVWDEYFEFNISHILIEINNFTTLVKHMRSILKSNKKYGTNYIKDEILKGNQFDNIKYKDVSIFIETKIKEKIKSQLVASEEFEKFENEILEIIT